MHPLSSPLLTGLSITCSDCTFRVLNVPLKLLVLVHADTSSLGWAFAYGDKLDADGNSINNAFIGTNNFAMSTTEESKYNTFLFQYVVRIMPAAFATDLACIAASSRSKAFALASMTPCIVHHDRVGTVTVLGITLKQPQLSRSLPSRPPRLCRALWPSASSSSPTPCTHSS